MLYLSSLPGGASNFFEKTLLLCDDVVLHRAKNLVKLLDMNVKQRFNALTKGLQCNWKASGQSWVELEHRGYIRQDLDLTTLQGFDGVCITAQGHSFNQKFIDETATENDKIFKVHISHGNDPAIFEWVVMNAMYKNTYLKEPYFNAYNAVHQMNDVYPVYIKDFLGSTNQYLESYVKVCDHLQINESNRYYDYVEQVHKLWIKTTLSPDKYADYKQKINWLI